MCNLTSCAQYIRNRSRLNTEFLLSSTILTCSYIYTYTYVICIYVCIYIYTYTYLYIISVSIYVYIIMLHITLLWLLLWLHKHQQNKQKNINSVFGSETWSFLRRSYSKNDGNEIPEIVTVSINWWPLILYLALFDWSPFLQLQDVQLNVSIFTIT